MIFDYVNCFYIGPGPRQVKVSCSRTRCFMQLLNKLDLLTEDFSLRSVITSVFTAMNDERLRVRTICLTKATIGLEPKSSKCLFNILLFKSSQKLL